MSAEIVEQLVPSFDVQQFTYDDLRQYAGSQMGLAEGQRVAGMNARLLEVYHDHMLLSRGVRLECTVMGSDVQNPVRTWDMYEGEDSVHNPAFALATELANTNVSQEIVTWVCSIGVKKYVEAPLPAIRQFSSSQTAKRKGW